MKDLKYNEKKWWTKKKVHMIHNNINKEFHIKQFIQNLKVNLNNQWKPIHLDHCHSNDFYVNNNGEWIQLSKIIFSSTVNFSRWEKHSWYSWHAGESRRFIREHSSFLVSHNVCPNSNILSGRESAAWADHVLFCLDCLQSANVDFSSVTKDKNLYEECVKHLILVYLLTKVLSNPASVGFFAFVSGGDGRCTQDAVFKSELGSKALIKLCGVYLDLEI